MVKYQNQLNPTQIRDKDRSEFYDAHKIPHSNSMKIAKAKPKTEFHLDSPQSSPEDLDFISHEIQDDHSEASDLYSCSDLDETDCLASLSLNSNLSESLDSEQHIPNLPFWFGVEDPDQIKQYIQEYDQHSQLDSERKRCVRAPKPFIGRVMRVPLSTTDFCTLDRVDIFYLEPVPLWCPLRYCRSLVFLTTWNSDSGELITMSLITNKEKFKHWESRQRLQHVSYLYCQPVFQRKYEFHYWADREKHEVYYSHVPFTYSKFIPESLLQKLQNSTNFCDIDDCCPI